MYVPGSNLDLNNSSPEIYHSLLHPLQENVSAATTLRVFISIPTFVFFFGVQRTLNLYQLVDMFCLYGPLRKMTSFQCFPLFGLVANIKYLQFIGSSEATYRALQNTQSNLRISSRPFSFSSYQFYAKFISRNHNC